jgi:hypothetical protein
LNLKSNETAEFLAKYLDFCLKKSSGQTNLGDEHTEKVIDDVIQIFRFVESKDIFEQFYSRSLMRRLLLKKSAS